MQPVKITYTLYFIQMRGKGTTSTIILEDTKFIYYLKLKNIRSPMSRLLIITNDLAFICPIREKKYLRNLQQSTGEKRNSSFHSLKVFHTHLLSLILNFSFNTTSHTRVFKSQNNKSYNRVS